MDRNITSQVWDKIKQEYISSSVSIRDLAKKYGVPRSTLSRRSSLEGWVKQREEIGTLLAQKVKDELLDQHIELYDLALDASMLILNQIKRQMTTISESADGIAGSEMKAYTSAMKDLREMGFFRAAMDRQEQEARIKKLQKECEEEQKDTTVTLVFEEDAYGD